MTNPAIIILSDAARPLADRLAARLGGEVHGAAGRCPDAPIRFEAAGPHLRALFREGRPIVALMAAGALIRILAPLLSDKSAEPPVVAVAEDGSAAVPLLGGHHGANDLARTIAAELGGVAAVTTAGDLRFGVALDAPPAGWRLANPEDAKPVMAALVAGAHARLDGEAAAAADWLTASRIPFAADGAVRLRASTEARGPDAGDLLYRPQSLALGVGCERHAPAEEAIALAEATLAEAGVSPLALAAIASIDLKADEPAVHAVAAHFGVPARFFAAAELEAEAPRLATPSDIVFPEIGCHGVAEGAALAAVGADGRLRLAKRKSRRVTCRARRGAAAARRRPHRPGAGQAHRGRHRPGRRRMAHAGGQRLVAAASDLVGYTLYLDLLGPLAEGKTRHDFDLGEEEARVRRALELAGEGRDVALVCSGDAGIYAMATLVFELLDKDGVSADAETHRHRMLAGHLGAAGGAARAGAPLGHDFCTISLSDLLTPWDEIQRRVRAAAEGDFVVAFYNPVSRKRRTQLAMPRRTPEASPGRHAGDPRPQSRPRRARRCASCRSSALDVDDVDMLTVVLVGSSDTRTVTTGDGREWVYTPRGYAGKAGTGMAESPRKDNAA